MTYEQVVRTFEEAYVDLYICKADYWTAEQAWACYIDGLCKDGEITERQFATWRTPFRYGKHLRPKKWMVAEGR